MSKKIVVFAMAMAFMAGSVTVSFAAKSVDCTVKSVSGSTVTMDCGDDAKDLAAGSKVKVKAAKKKAIEGC